jgi:hypothetical protein
MKTTVYLFGFFLLLCGMSPQTANLRVSYTIKVTSPVPGEEAKVTVQSLDLEEYGDPVTTERTTPFEIHAEDGVFSGSFSRLAGAAEVQVDVYCEGCNEEESPILYGHGTRITLMLEDDLRTFDVRK